MNKKIILPLTILFVAGISFVAVPGWQSRFVTEKKDGALIYQADENGNRIPDFSRVGYYHGDREIPMIPVVKTVSAGATEADIQAAIAEVSKKPLQPNGFRGAVLLKKGTYTINQQITIRES